ncbi:MAG: Ig-like domain-containing protein [Clostridia bacterium]|nr:Ig-like domain-containing protein [Clostridia bacterium]
MRALKWVSALTILALLFAVLPATMAEDDIIIDMEEAVDEEFVVDLDALDDSSIALESDTLDLDGLEDNLLISEEGEYTEVSPASNASGDFEIDEYGVLIRYRGFAKNVVIPDGVKSIGDDAFKDADFIESASIPSSVTNIGYRAFSGCAKINSITIPSSVIETGGGVFSYCSSLTSVQLSNNLTTLSSELFYGCESLEEISLPASIKKIEYYAFSGCASLKSIILPDGVTDIEKGAFQYCDSLESVTIPSSVTMIDREAFSGSENVVIRGVPDSYAERFAKGIGIPFNAPIVVIDDPISNMYEDSLILYINQSCTLSASQKPADLSRTLAWSSSNSEVVSVDQSGKIKGLLQGTASITVNTADSNGKAAQINIIVPEPTDIELSYNYGDDTEITLGEISTIRAETNTPYSYITNTEMPISWSSSDSSVISIEASDDNGATIKGNKLGKATITASTPDNGTAFIELEVVRPQVESIKIDQTGPITLHPGDQYSLTATLSPEQSESALTWSSDDTDIATVSDSGIVTAVAEGYTWIEVYTENEKSDAIRVNVEPLHPHPDSIKIDQSGPIKLYPGQKYSLSTTLMPADAEAKLKWSSDDKDVATVDQDGIVTAVEPGDTRIWVETDNECSDVIDIYVLTPPKKITLSKTEATLAVGDTLMLKKKLTPDNAETGFTWSSSKPSVATVTQKGKVAALKVGKAKITVKTDNGKLASATITVKPAPTKVKLNKTKATLGVKEKLTLKATVSPSKAYTTLTWKSSKPAVAAVSSQGVVIPKKPGTAVITVRTKNGKTAKFTVTVKAAPKKVTLNRSGTVELKKGKKLKLKATLPDNTASALTWTSSAPKVASVDQKGNVRALKKGTAVITVKTFNGKTAKVTVTVK